MYQELLKQISDNCLEYSESMQKPCTDAQISTLKANVQNQLQTDLPQGYINFLKQHNGLDWNGLLIYASENSTISGYEDRFIAGFVEMNLSYRESEACQEFLFFGESGVDSYVYEIKTQQYQIIDRISFDVYETLSSFDLLLTEALKIHI